MTFTVIPGGGEMNALIAPAGTRIVLQQSAAPFGWTVDSGAAFTDAAVRFNQSTSTAGTTNWSAWNFGGTFNINAFTLSTAQLPAHSHGISDPGHSHGLTDPGHFHNASNAQPFQTAGSSITFVGGGGGAFAQAASTNTVATGITMATATTGITTTNTGSGSSITPSITTPQVKYADVIVAIKS